MALFKSKIGGAFCLTFALVSQAALAAQTTTLTCPTAEQIQQFEYVVGFPYGVNNESKRAKFITLAAEKESLFDYTNGIWGLVVYPVQVAQSDDIQETTNAIIQHLEPVSSVPFKFNYINDKFDSTNGSKTEYFCIYTFPTLPPNNPINALAYYIDDAFVAEGAETVKRKNARQEPRQLLMKFAKQLLG